MGAKIAVIGLHQLGQSIGLALKQYGDKVTLVGFDPEPAQNDKVAKKDIFQRIEKDGETLLNGTDLIVLAVPADEVHPMIVSIAKWIKPGACVIDTSLLVQHMDEFAAVTLPGENSFITAIPVLNPAYLDESGEALEEAHADLFKGGALIICSGMTTQPGVIKTVGDFAELLGAHPYFTDTDEAAAILTKVELLPKLAAAVFLNQSVAGKIHNDSHRLADKAFLHSTKTIENLHEIEEFGKSFLQNRESSLQSIDKMIETLMQVREWIEANDAAALQAFFSSAQASRADWLEYKRSLDWSTPSGSAKAEKREVAGHIPWFGNFGEKKRD